MDVPRFSQNVRAGARGDNLSTFPLVLTKCALTPTYAPFCFGLTLLLGSMKLRSSRPTDLGSPWVNVSASFCC